MSSKGRYKAGYAFNGVVHAKCCDCGKCSNKRAMELGNATIAKMSEPVKRNEDATIFVRAHFRKGRHLTKMPNTRRWLKQFLPSTFK